MKTEHTPGPWAYDADSMEVFSDTEEYGCGWVSLVKGNDSKGVPLPERERLANASLIAAAPELLSALIEVMNWASMDSRLHGIVTDAISKARGFVWRIRQVGSTLEWSNEFGWTGAGCGDEFTHEDTKTLNLPIGGEWVMP